MLKDLFNAIMDNTHAQKITLCGRTYTTKNVYPVKSPQPETLSVRTLSGFVDYINANVDKLNTEQLLCHVVSPSEVRLYSALAGDFAQRETYVSARLEQLQIPLNKMINNEMFCIAMQACFSDDTERRPTDKGLVLKFASSVKSLAEAAMNDDGVAQAVNVQTRITSKEVKELPNPVLLAPFRTFPEIEQPASKFVFRAKNDEGAMLFGLFEADGGAWESEAMKSIKEYMTQAVPGLHVIA